MRVPVITLALCLSLTACAQQQLTHGVKAKQADPATVNEQCKSEILTATELDPVRNKIELYRQFTDGPPSFEIASNDTFPTDAERPLIAKWATMRESCAKRREAFLSVPSSANAQQAAIFQQEVSFARDANARISELIAALYQQKVTYGEFAQKRYWLVEQAVTSERAYRQSVLDRDQELQTQAQQQFANTLTAWGNYMQAVNARQPRTVYINGTTRVQ